MSVDSPAKQKRIEQHLMRQRGAGVRTVSSNFDFAFGTSAPPSSNPTPPSEEPSQKRRKTCSQDVLCAIEPSIDVVASRIKGAAAIADVKLQKTRRRWVAQNEEEGTARGAVADTDDSFVRGLQAKRAAAKNDKKTTIPEEAEAKTVDVVVAEPTANGRSRKRAAASATRKGTDGFAEEALPLEKEGQDLEPEKKRKRTRKKKGEVISTDSLAGENDALPKQTSASNRVEDGKCSPQMRKRKTRLKAGHEGIPLPRGDQAEGVDSVDRAQVLNTVKPTSRKRKRNEITEQRSTTGELQDSCARRPQLDVNENVNDAAKSVPIVKSRKKKSDNEASKVADTVDLSNTESKLVARRQPLKDTDMNATMRYASPEKAGTGNEKAPPMRKVAIGISELPVKDDRVTSRPSNRRKLRVQRDHAEVGGKVEDDVSQAGRATTEESDGELRRDHTKRISSIKSVGEKLPTKFQNPRANNRLATTTAAEDYRTYSKREESTSENTALQEAVTKDEDIDWLLEPPNVNRGANISRKRAAPSRKVPKTPVKMADMDLDDLLSDIASFAKADGFAGIEQARLVGGKTVKTSRQRRQG